MTFQAWFNEADIPIKDENGWYDAETGIPFKAISTKKTKTVKTAAEQNYGKKSAAQIKSVLDRLMSSAKITIERESHLDVSAVAAVLESYESSSKLTKSDMIDLIEANSKASRIVNAQR